MNIRIHKSSHTPLKCFHQSETRKIHTVWCQFYEYKKILSYSLHRHQNSRNSQWTVVELTLGHETYVHNDSMSASKNLYVNVHLYINSNSQHKNKSQQISQNVYTDQHNDDCYVTAPSRLLRDRSFTTVT